LRLRVPRSFQGARIRGTMAPMLDDTTIAARITELAVQIRSILSDPDATDRQIRYATVVLMPELQRLAEHVEAEAGPRFVRGCDVCGRLELATRWRTMTDAEEAIAAGRGAPWHCRGCGSAELIVVEVPDVVTSRHRVGPLDRPRPED
jgi:hypothetical protein